MINLDSRKEIAKIDIQNVLGSVEELPNQCLDAWDQAKGIKVPVAYKNIHNVVMTGMGGSGLGGRVIESVYRSGLKLPLVLLNDYNLPGFVNEKTLVICSSYSGTTEETVKGAHEAIKKKAKWMAIGTGNTLIDMAKEHNAPFYQINPVYNPSSQPRMAIGYSIIGQLILASKVGLFRLSKRSINNIVKVMRNVQKACRPEVSFNDNPAKKLAHKMKGKVIFYISARHMAGAIHVINNQLNENAKNFSFDFILPELNHHLMEGLKHPETNTQNLFVFFADSDLYPTKIKKRLEITLDVVSQNKIETFVCKLRSRTKLGQAFELIQFGGYVNLYLSVLYGQNPAPIPWVDYFKEKLGQPLGK